VSTADRKRPRIPVIEKEKKAKLLQQAGRGQRPNKAGNLRKEEVEVLCNESKFGSASPGALVNTMWWILTQHFGLRGRQEHHNMKLKWMSSGSVCKDDNGRQTKTRKGTLYTKL